MIPYTECKCGIWLSEQEVNMNNGEEICQECYMTRHWAQKSVPLPEEKKEEYWDE